MNFRDTNSGELIVPDALKIISNLQENENTDFVETEVELLSSIKHEHIVAMKDFKVIDKSWYIRMELMKVLMNI